MSKILDPEATATETSRVVEDLYHAVESTESPESILKSLVEALDNAWNEGHAHCFHVEDPNNQERSPYKLEKLVFDE